MSEPANHPTPPSPRRRLRKRWIILALGVALCAWFGRFAYLRITLRPTPRPAYWEAKLAALDPPPPGAVPAREAIALISAPPWLGHPALTAVPDNRVSDLLRGKWTPNRADVVTAKTFFLTPEFQDARREILRMAAAGWEEPISLDVDADTLWQPYRSMQAWLLAHSRWAVEQAEDQNTAVEDWLGTLGLARQMHRGQHWMRLILESRAFVDCAQEMVLAAKAGVVLPDMREFTMNVDQIVGPPRGPRELLEATRLSYLALLESIYVREGGDWLDVSETAKHWTARVGRTIPPPSRLWNLASPLFHSFSESQARLEAYWDRAALCDTLVACRLLEREEEEGNIVADVLDGFYRPSFGRTGPQMSTVLAFYYHARSTLDAGLAILALESYKHDHGHYPDTLDELLPDYLPREPIDYADRKPLRYRRTDDRYVLYSIGADGRDDGGDTTIDVRWRYLAWDAKDVVFSEFKRLELP